MAYSYFECHFHAPYASYPNLNFSPAALAMVHFGARLVFSFVILPCIIDCQSRSFLIICVPSIPKLIDFALTQIVLSMPFFIQNQINYLQFQPINCQQVLHILELPWKCGDYYKFTHGCHTEADAEYITHVSAVRSTLSCLLTCREKIYLCSMAYFDGRGKPNLPLFQYYIVHVHYFGHLYQQSKALLYFLNHSNNYDSGRYVQYLNFVKFVPYHPC